MLIEAVCTRVMLHLASQPLSKPLLCTCLQYIETLQCNLLIQKLQNYRIRPLSQISVEIIHKKPLQSITSYFLHIFCKHTVHSVYWKHGQRRNTSHFFPPLVGKASSVFVTLQCWLLSEWQFLHYPNRQLKGMLIGILAACPPLLNSAEGKKITWPATKYLGVIREELMSHGDALTEIY